MRLISESTDTHAVRIKGKKKLQLKSSAFNRFSSKRVCIETVRRFWIEKGRDEKVCVETVASKSFVSLKTVAVLIFYDVGNRRVHLCIETV